MNIKELEKQIKEGIEKNIENGKPREIWYSPHYNNTDLKLYFVEEIRSFLLKGTHSNSETTRILKNINPYNLMNICDQYYIFTRFYLTLNHKNKISFNYCAGQDYIAERKTMRELIIKKY